MAGMSSPVTRIYFQHVTKCGGTSLRVALQEALTLQGVTTASFYELDPVIANALGSATGIDNFTIRDVVLADRLAQQECRYVAGHFRFTSALHAQALASVFSVTVLREPADRFLSLYYYNYFKEASHGKENLPLEDYITTPRARRCAEDYVRLFRGTGADNRDFSSAEDVTLAQGNLDRFSAVGCLEYMPEFIAKLKNFGLVLRLPKLNESPAPAAIRCAELPADLMQEINRMCLPSLRIYEHALSLGGVANDNHRLCG